MDREKLAMSLLPLLVIIACGTKSDPDTNTDTGVQGTTTTGSASTDTSDGTTIDSIDTGGGNETGSVTTESGTQSTDTGAWAEFGSISGDCGVLTAENLSDDSPWAFANTINFGALEFHEWRISEEAEYILEADNAGGSSLYSEIYAFEVLRRCEDAGLIKTETEVVYTVSDGSITDMLLEIDGYKIGVSVTRAYGWPPEDPYTEEMALTLLEKKLEGIIESSLNVSPEDAWEKQVLHVIAYTPDHANTIIETFGNLESSIKTDTVLFVTATEGEDEFLY